MKEEEQELARLERVADSIPSETMVGRVASFPIADGSAMYLVKSESPLTLALIDFFDGYGLPSAHLRGLRLDDIRRVVRGSGAIRKVVADPSGGSSTMAS